MTRIEGIPRSPVDPAVTLGVLVAERPARAALFERLRLDYCCGGRQTLAEACRERGLEADSVRAALQALDDPAVVDEGSEPIDWRGAGIAGLCAHIVTVHHGGLRDAFPRIDALLCAVVRVHGRDHPELGELQRAFAEFRVELEQHLAINENGLFPACLERERHGTPIAESLLEEREREHWVVGHGLAALRVLGRNYDRDRALRHTHRALLDALEAVELDLHQHIHEENNILIPRVRELNAQLRATPPRPSASMRSPRAPGRVQEPSPFRAAARPGSPSRTTPGSHTSHERLRRSFRARVTHGGGPYPWKNGEALLVFCKLECVKCLLAVDAPFAIGPDDVLAQPTRAALFALLGELKRPVGTVELAQRLDLHPNGVRIHLERMAQAGLVERARDRQPRGRPRDAWTIAPGAQPGGEAPSAYQDLGRWLARAIRSPRGGLRGIEETGHEIGREIAPTGAAADPEAFNTSLSALGFKPTVERHDGERVTFCLGNCPYRDAVRENQPAVCALHKGITRGLLDVLHPNVKLVGFVPHDPDQAGCLIELRGLDAAAK